jgi:hypothetical protein
MKNSRVFYHEVLLIRARKTRARKRARARARKIKATFGNFRSFLNF